MPLGREVGQRAVGPAMPYAYAPLRVPINIEGSTTSDAALPSLVRTFGRGADLVDQVCFSRGTARRAFVRSAALSDLVLVGRVIVGKEGLGVGLARSSPAAKAAGPLPSLRLIPRPSAALLRDDRDVQHSPRRPAGDSQSSHSRRLGRVPPSASGKEARRPVARIPR